MSDRIKKIKIKQQDGTMSDYYDIGVNAQNVDINYNNSNLETTLRKTPKYYDNVASMKLDDTLVEGDLAITLGYYAPNDGGSAEYNIIDGNYTDDGGSYHQLTNELFAELIIKNFITPEQIGAKAMDNTFDNAPFFSKAISIAADKNTTLRFPGEKKFYTLTSIILPQDKKVRIYGNTSFNNENTRNIVYLGNDAMFNSYDNTPRTYYAEIHNLNFYLSRTASKDVSIFKNIIFRSSTIDYCCFLNAGNVFDYGGLNFCSILSNCKSLFIKNAVFNHVTTENLSDIIIRDNYFNAKTDTYGSFIKGKIDNDNIFENNYLDYWKYIIETDDSFGSQWINNRLEPCFRFSNGTIKNLIFVHNFVNSRKVGSIDHWGSGDTFMVNAEWGLFIKDPNDTYWEPTYNFNFRNLTCIGNALSRDTRLIYVIGEFSGASDVGPLIESDTIPSSDYGLMEDAVFYHPWSTNASFGVYRSKCDSNKVWLDSAPTTGELKNYTNLSYTSAETGESVTVKGCIAFDKDTPKKFLDANNKVHIYTSKGRGFWEITT